MTDLPEPTSPTVPQGAEIDALIEQLRVRRAASKNWSGSAIDTPDEALWHHAADALARLRPAEPISNEGPPTGSHAAATIAAETGAEGLMDPSSASKPMTMQGAEIDALIEQCRGMTMYGDVLEPEAQLWDKVADMLARLRPAEPLRWAPSWTGRANVNLNGDAFVHIWPDNEWVIIHSRSGGVETTLSLTKSQAFDVAIGLTPELWARFERARTAENALYALSHPSADPATLRKIADEIDCGFDCELRQSSGPCRKAEKDGMCGFENATDLRDFADALERRAMITAAPDIWSEGRDAPGTKEEEA